MITNQRQYKISLAQAKKFAQAIKAAETSAAPVDIDPRIHQALIDGLRSQFDELAADLRAYESLRSGKVRRRTITSLLELPTVLIEGRIAKQMTQKRLAQKLDLPEQQIQRYEATRYAGVSLERLQQISNAIGLQLRKTVDFDLPTPVAADIPTARTVGSAQRKSLSRGPAKRSTARTTAQRSTAATSHAKRSSAKTTAKRSPAKAAKSSSPKKTTTTKAKRTTAKKTVAGSTARSSATRTTAKSRSSNRATAKRSTSGRGSSRTR